MKFTHSIISLALISALTACGGSSSSSTPPPIVEPPAPAPVPVKTVIQGKAIKGTIANAVVSVYKYVDGQAVELDAAELETASIITEDDGSYTITILDYEGPIKVELSVDENTTMICDAPAGCGEVAYGAPIALSTIDPNLVLSAISTVGSDNAGAANVNVSALTHLASALIESDENGVSAESIQTQSSVIANAFNIMGSLTELEPTAVENAASVAGEDNADELRYGLINAGIMTALFSGETDATGVLSARLSEVVDDLVEHDGALLVNQDEADEGFELSLVEVLDGAGEAAVAAAEAIAADPELASQDNSEILGELEQQETNLENQSEYEVANENEDGRSEPEVEVPTEGDAIAKAKAMVDDVRLFSHLFEVGTDSNTGIATEGDKYIELIDSAGVLVEAEAASFLLLADVADALSEISMMYDAGAVTEGTFPIGSFLSIEGAVGTITLDEETDNGGMLFTINATSGTEKVALNAAVVIAEDGLSIMLNLDGSIESAGAMLSLTEGSFAKVNLDSALSRATLEDDSYEGEVTSGELSLEVVVEQKATDTVTNPVAFTGLIKTKLMPVVSNVLDAIEEYARDEEGRIIRDENDNPVREIDRYKKSIEISILPEMLTLSGGFSSGEGNLIKATLTVNINDLESYDAPEFQNIGAPIADIITVTVSDDKNTLTAMPSELVESPHSYNVTFTSNGSQGAWSTVAKTFDLDESNEVAIYTTTTTRIPKTYGSMSGFDTATDQVTSAFFETVTPNDENNDGVAESYTWKGFSGSEINGDNALVNHNGEVHDLITPEWGSQTWDTFEQLMEAHRMYPASIANAADVYVFEVDYFRGGEVITNLTNGSRASVFFDNEDYAAIISNSSTKLAANITSDAPIEDVISIQVSADSNEVITTLGNMVSTTTYNGTSSANFTYAVQTVYDAEYTWTDTRTLSTSVSGFATEELLVNRTRMDNEDFAYYEQLKVTPIDEDKNGEEDTFVIYRLGSYFADDNGDLIDEDGTLLTFEANGWEAGRFVSYDEVNWSEPPFKYILPFNPFTTENALMAFTANVNNRMDNIFHGYEQDIGDIESEISSDDLATLTTDSTTMFDGYITHPDSEESLENEDVFLDVSAALSLEAILGDYQVNIMLSGNRTALDEGKFDLEMSYKLPDDENMRKFIAHMKTDGEGSFSVNNSEGVLLIMNESDDPASDVIGSIVVGSSATKVADIEDRDGVIWIIYTDETNETL